MTCLAIFIDGMPYILEHSDTQSHSADWLQWQRTFMAFVLFKNSDELKILVLSADTLAVIRFVLSVR